VKFTGVSDVKNRVTISLLLALCVSVVTLAVTSTSARAGIIVTVGKPTPEDASKRTKPGASLGTGDRTTSTGAPCPSDAVPDKSQSGSCTQSQKIDPVTGLPADWKCVPIGGGLLYCEAPTAGAGGSAGPGGQGAWDGATDDEDFEDLDDDLNDADDELQVMGCSGGGSTSGLLALALVVLALFGLRRARAHA